VKIELIGMIDPNTKNIQKFKIFFLKIILKQQFIRSTWVNLLKKFNKNITRKIDMNWPIKFITEVIKLK